MSEEWTQPEHCKETADKLDRAIMCLKSKGLDFEKVVVPLMKDIFCSYHRPQRKHMRILCDKIWEEVKKTEI